MGIEDSPPVESVREREIDYTMAQLLDTSARFRDWFVATAVPSVELDEYVGVITHAYYAGEGESDIEFGFLTQAGDRHVVLIENKIDAAKQPDQIERYHNRGQIRVERENWDSFTVCLLAPERYVSPDDKTGFDSILSYEDVQTQLEDLDHDGASFFQDIFETALSKSSTVDASATVATIEDRFQARTELSFTNAFAGRKRLAFQSTHPQHPDAIWYETFIGKAGEAGNTTVRLHIESLDGQTDERRDSLKSMVAGHTELLPEYDWHPHRKANLLNTKVWHEDAIRNSDYDDYIDGIVAELLHLVSTFHPVIVDSDLP